MRSALDSTLKALASAVLAVLLATGSAQADSDKAPSHWGPVAFDAAMLRPLNAVATVVGAVLFVPVAVVTSPGGKTTIADAWDVFVVVPAERAFMRPLGSY